jgi:hypothetical protein
LDFITGKGQPIPLEFPQANEIRQFQRRSLSCHALKDLGYEVQDAFLTNGNVLCLCKVGSTTDWNAIPLVTHEQSDYGKVNLHLPVVAGIMPFIGEQALRDGVEKMEMLVGRRPDVSKKNKTKALPYKKLKLFLFLTPSKNQKQYPTPFHTKFGFRNCHHNG